MIANFYGKKAKPYIEELTESNDIIILNFDDLIQEKQYTDENELNTWHFDHVFRRSVKGVNFITALVEVGGMHLSCCGIEFIKKDILVTHKKRQVNKSVKVVKLRMNCLEKCFVNAVSKYTLIMFWLIVGFLHQKIWFVAKKH